jgi:hypothetical protein
MIRTEEGAILSRSPRRRTSGPPFPCYTPSMDEDEIKRIPPSKIHFDESARDLLSSPDMQPYVRLAMAGLQGSNVDQQLQAIREIPLEKRYIWRVASALKWAFADFDTLNVRVDRDTLADQDLAVVLKMLELRPIQFCMFLKALVGPLVMAQMMGEAIKVATDLGEV